MEKLSAPPEDQVAPPHAKPIEYVAGFLFSSDGKSIVLVRKNRPDWQAGKLNGVGGHIEPGEMPLGAMYREFQEEAGATPAWRPFCILSGEGFRVHFFRAFDDYAFASTWSRTDEKIERHYTMDLFRSPLNEQILPNLNWLIPMALSIDNDGRLKYYTVGEH